MVRNCNFGLFSNTTSGGGGGTGTVTVVAANAGTGICITGSPYNITGLLCVTNTAPYNGEAVIILDSAANSTVRCGVGNCASATSSGALSGKGNTTSGSYGIISGGTSNSVTAIDSSILGGNANTVSGCRSVVVGGRNNSASGNYSFIGGGCLNVSTQCGSVIVGGKNNCDISCVSFIGGGINHQIKNVASVGSFIGGGVGNIVCCGDRVTIAGGQGNIICGNLGFIGGGFQNTNRGGGSSIVAGYCNQTFSNYSSIIGGNKNINCSQSAFIGTGLSNTVSSSYAAILSGCCNTTNATLSTLLNGCSNILSGAFSLIGGGKLNCLCTSCSSSIVGGDSNVINGGNNSFIGGGANNTVTASFSGAVGCGLTASSACTFYSNNFCACGSLYTSAIATSCAVCVTTNGQLVGYTPIGGTTVNYGLFSQTGNSTPVTATTVETSIIDGGVGTLTVPANGFSVGDSFFANLSGLMSAQNNNTLTIRVKSGSVILADSGPLTMPQITNQVWTATLEFTIRTLGAAGVASIQTLGQLHILKAASGTQEGFGFNTLNNTTFDTTISNTLSITAQWSSNSANNSIFTNIFVLNKVY